jgi:hypothetical protein
MAAGGAVVVPHRTASRREERAHDARSTHACVHLQIPGDTNATDDAQPR